MPVLTHCTLWLRRWRHVSLSMHAGEQGSSNAYQDKYRRYPAPVGWVETLAEEDLLLPDPEPLDPGVPGVHVLELNNVLQSTS